MLNKEKLIGSINARMTTIKEDTTKDTTEEKTIKIKELKALLYVINKGCYDYE